MSSMQNHKQEEYFYSGLFNQRHNPLASIRPTALSVIYIYVTASHFKICLNSKIDNERNSKNSIQFHKLNYIIS